MTGRESHQHRVSMPADAGAMDGERVVLSRVDPPAPSEAAAVLQAGTAAASTLSAWMLAHARDDVMRGRHVPEELAALVRDLLNPPTFPSEHPFESPAKLEISSAQMAERTGYTVQHIRRLCRAGRLPARRAGRDWWVTVEEEHQDDHEGRHTG